VSNHTRQTIDAVRKSLSFARISTYEAAAQVSSAEDPAALELYAWNANISSALLTPLHICEVVIRNAVVEAVSKVYGPRWPWSTTFEQSLPAPRFGYSARADLLRARRSAATPGKVIPELTFMFWQQMFTHRYDVRIWEPHLRQVFPNAAATIAVKQHRQTIFQDMEKLRKLRNRIAHHEPIFSRNLNDDYQKMRELIGFRCAITATWLDQIQQVTAVMATKP